MKREGRQHGMVRTYQIRPPEFYRGPPPRYNRSDSPSTAGLFTKVSTKPTNHSKYTSKCRKPICNCCHDQPVCKSKNKSKGTQKLRSINRGLDDLPMADAQFGQNLSGLSAALILDHLTNDSNCYFYYHNSEYDDDDHHVEEEEDEEENKPNHTNLTAPHSDEEENKPNQTNLTAAHSDDVVVVSNENNDNDNMNFCDVGYVWEHAEDDGDWCLVMESMD